MAKFINSHEVELHHGKLWIDGVHRFLKIGKPLLNFGCASQIDAFISELPIVQEKGFNVLDHR